MSCNDTNDYDDSKKNRDTSALIHIGADKNIIEDGDAKKKIHKKDKSQGKLKDFVYLIIKWGNKKGLLIFYSIFSLILILIAVITLPFFLYYFYEKGVKHNFIFMCFEFDMDYYHPFTTDIIAFLLLLSILEFTFFLSIYSLIRNDIKEILIFRSLYSIIFWIIIILFIIPFIIGYYSLRSYTTIKANICLSFLNILFISVILRKIEHKRYKNLIPMVVESFMPCLFLCIEVYAFLFNVFDYFTRTERNLTLKTSFKLKMNIGANFVYFCVGVFMLTYFRDIIFPVGVIIIETGFLTKVNTFHFWEIVTPVIVILFLFYSVVLVIMKNQLMFFRLHLNEDEKQLLIKGNHSYTKHKYV